VTFFDPIVKNFEPNSAPIVCVLSSLTTNLFVKNIEKENQRNFDYLQVFSRNRCKIQDFPVDALPIMRNLNR